ncbi:MAG: DUF3267 domain-containing protein [Oscillospiraceae bacterium]|nr:DUF3267 domain-containing protein [Oscillospiraceae bacterium]
MIYLFKPLPSSDMDYSNWTPFIKNAWLRKNFMKFVYSLQVVLYLVALMLGVWNFANGAIQTIILVLLLVVHELLHMLVVYKIGDISVTYSGLFFWINSTATMSKKRYWLFVTLPLLVLTVIPIFILPFTDGVAFQLIRFIVWLNMCMSSFDIIKSILVAIKPSNAKFNRGYYIVETQGM